MINPRVTNLPVDMAAAGYDVYVYTMNRITSGHRTYKFATSRDVVHAHRRAGCGQSRTDEWNPDPVADWLVV